MKVIKLIITTLGILLIIALFVGWYIGFFKKLKINEEDQGGFTVVGTNYTGAYSKTGKVMDDLKQKLKKMSIQSNKDFGIYYDDPYVTPEEKCRSFVGSILKEEDYDKIPELIAGGMKVDTIQKTKAASVEFPLKNSLSFMMGPIKAYPVISKFMLDKGYKALTTLEIYDFKKKKIIYIMQHD